MGTSSGPHGDDSFRPEVDIIVSVQKDQIRGEKGIRSGQGPKEMSSRQRLGFPGNLPEGILTEIAGLEEV